ncbi:hypothetical protein [Arenimonas caeni]|uniref:DUF2268 domain-containing protein n=1 Tax=Arenimonas caeni TaxID=2058085 RepID=A0A2P6M8V9_9GAMM|nr:hypothetical protein [Arenimonas caeni]PRH82423.1 hypothetical protein C6N40_07860 [Arenimonas caeni]
MTPFRLCLLLLPLLLAALPGESRASFGDCADPAYRDQFDARLRDVDYDCVERSRVEVATPFGRHHIRVVHDRSADWIVEESLLEEIDRGVRLTAEALQHIGRFEIVDTTVLVADDLPPDETLDEIGGIAGMANFAGNHGECQVIFYAMGPGADLSHAAAVVAHELFHCVQRSTFDPRILDALVTARGPAWWLEGSADWFASMAVPDPAYFQRRADAFDDDSPDMPLTRMTYQNLVFFLWLADQRGSEGVMPFLASLSQEAGEAAQQVALAAALPEADWQAFARDYLDGRIHRPAGAFRVSPRDGPEWAWDGSTTQRVALRPFVLERARVRIGCGDWDLGASPARWHGARPDDGADWGPFPADLDTQAGDPDTWRFAALLAANSRTELRLAATRRSGCGDCAGSVRTDACLVGHWQLSSGGAAQWLRDNLPPNVRMTQVEQAGETLLLGADGRYQAGRMTARGRFEADGSDGITRGIGQLTAVASGRWSAEGGQLNLCPDTETMSGRATVTPPGGPSIGMPLGAAGTAGPMRMRYTCREGGFETETPIRNMPPMRSGYTPIPPAGG